jgi:nucleotide-binding universal stress UspA family protein
MAIFPPKRILVAVDFGEASAHAVRLAGALATRFDAALTGLHAESLEAPLYFTHDQIEALERQQMEARSRAARYLQKFAARQTPAPIEARIADGPPAAAVLDAAAGHDLIVMGTHGRRGPSRWWLGSVAERVLRNAALPVLVVRAAEAHHEAAEHFQRILLVTDGGGNRQEADRVAAGLADAFGGPPQENLTRCTEAQVEHHNASLLVLGLPHLDGRLPDVAERMVRTCQVPMLFVPE